jgi:glycerol 3-phosphatase-1
VILATSHGRRSIDTLQELDPSRANWEYVSKIEGALPRKHGASARELPGARLALDTLTTLGAPWAIVTSGTTALMTGWLDVMKLPPPPIRVVAEDVAVGKPDPACYRLGRERVGLGADATILVLEDAPAGVRAGKAAGCKVLGLATTHSIESIRAAGADWVVEDLASLKVLSREEGKTRVEIKETWVES